MAIISKIFNIKMQHLCKTKIDFQRMRHMHRQGSQLLVRIRVTNSRRHISNIKIEIFNNPRFKDLFRDHRQMQFSTINNSNNKDFSSSNNARLHHLGCNRDQHNHAKSLERVKSKG